MTKPDTQGRLLGMIETVAGYARESGVLEPARIDAHLGTVQGALEQKTYLAIAPQFLVTARRMLVERKLRPRSRPMTRPSTAAVATLGIDIGKNLFHLIRLNERGAITLRQRLSRRQLEARLTPMPPHSRAECAQCAHIVAELLI